MRFVFGLARSEPVMAAPTIAEIIRQCNVPHLGSEMKSATVMDRCGILRAMLSIKRRSDAPLPPRSFPLCNPPLFGATCLPILATLGSLPMFVRISAPHWRTLTVTRKCCASITPATCSQSQTDDGRLLRAAADSLKRSPNILSNHHHARYYQHPR